MAKTYIAEGVVLKRINYAEADRIVTIFSRDRGKISCLAKSVRKLNSKKRSALEPATQAKFFFVQTKSLDILTQAELISSHKADRPNLVQLTQIYQLLEIIDNLTVEDQPYPEVYQLLIQSLAIVNRPGAKKSMLLENIRLILKNLGFTYDKKFTETKLKLYIEELAERKLRSKPFLTVNSDSVKLT